eukprot:snap_masked-scaffold914_size81644-processed-gene-0.5 protein:Tk06188 transcript:snap_masked-scaffold914_size81644-processed-gene-0.5-mRNA-1 annotation:"poly(3-hydroxyalkanoate) synthetase"
MGMGIGRQAAIFAGLPETVPAYSINMVCGSGMKAVMDAVAHIRCGDADVVVAAGIEQRDVEFGDYVTEGVVKAISAIEDITGQSQINAAGYCIGGTVLASTIAYYAAKRMKARIKSASFFTTLLDFAQPGEVGAYINESLVSAIELQNTARGYMDGRSLSVTFSLLRENSLYWNYYVDNYLKGNSPVDFDLLYWNSDSTNVAATTHNFMLRELYLNNRLVEDKGVKVGGVWIDLSKIKIPTYFISAKEDHIALWQGTYRVG